MTSVMQLILTAFLLFWSCLPGFAADSPEYLLEQANGSYTSGRFDDAIVSYKAIIASHGLSAHLLSNLGSSYAQQGKYGYAILQYLRALQLEPGDSDSKGNLELVRNQAGIFTSPPSILHRLSQLLDMNRWIMVALTGYIGTVLITGLFYLFPQSRILKTLLPAMLLIMLTGSTGAWLEHDRWNGGVIISPDSRIMVSPYSNASTRGTLQEGTRITCRSYHQSFCYIDDNQGRSGWIAMETYRPIVTSRATYSQEYAE